MEMHEPLKNRATTREDRLIEEIRSQMSPLIHYDAGRRTSDHIGAGIQIDS